jgi:hypothetical protein
MSKPVTSHIEKLKEQRSKMDARIQAAQAREKNSERKKDMRRKILVGAYYLDQAITHNQMDQLKEKMHTYLQRESDRQLFDLPELENKSLND